MPQRLQDILGKLYRPPADGARQVFALSRSGAERLSAREIELHLGRGPTKSN